MFFIWATKINLWKREPKESKNQQIPKEEKCWGMTHNKRNFKRYFSRQRCRRKKWNRWREKLNRHHTTLNVPLLLSCKSSLISEMIICYLVNKWMLVLRYFNLYVLVRKPDVFYSEYFPDEWIDQLYVNKHLILCAADAYKGRMHEYYRTWNQFF